jgi:hypothetical protein
LIDGGETHNFIGVALIARRELKTEEFEGFDVAFVDSHTVECLDRVLDLRGTYGQLHK